MRRIGLLSLSGLLVVSAARAQADPSGPEPKPGPLAWDERDSFELEASIGPSLVLLASKGESTLHLGGTIAVGFRRIRPYESGNSGGEKDFWPNSVPGMIWCAPIFCGGLGMLFMPTSAFVGTEIGADLRVRVSRQVTGDPGGVIFGAGLRPVFRVAAPESRWRGASIVGTYLPEVGFDFPTAGSPSIYLDWGLFPFTVMIARGVAIEWIYRVGPEIDLVDARVSARMSGNLSLVLP